MESGGRKGTQRIRLGRNGIRWEKETQNEVGKGWSLMGERDTEVESEENWEKTHGMHMLPERKD